MSDASMPFEEQTSAFSAEALETYESFALSETIPTVTEERTEQNEVHLLVASVPQSDKKTFSALVDQYSTLLLRTATLIIADHDIAEEIVHDALMQAWYCVPDAQEAGDVRLRLMHSIVNRSMRSMRRFPRAMAFMRLAHWTQKRSLMTRRIDDHKEHFDRDWDLARAIENLPVKQRLIIVLRYYNGMTLSEMAQVLQVSEKILKKRNLAALQHLCRVLHLTEEYALLKQQ